MVDVVKQISDALNSTIQATLPDYKPLDYFYNPQKNQFHGNAKRFGVAVDSGSSFETITKAITIEQNFNVVLTNDYTAHDDESALASAILELHDAMNDIYIAVFNTKLGLPTLVYRTGPLSFTAPLIDEEQQNIILTMGLSLSYRTSLI